MDTLPTVKGLRRKLDPHSLSYSYVRKESGPKLTVKHLHNLGRLFQKKRLKMFAVYCFYTKNCPLKWKCWDLKNANWNFDFIPSLKQRKKLECIAWINPITYYHSTQRIKMDKLKHIAPWNSVEILKEFYSLGLGKFSLKELIFECQVPLEQLRLALIRK